MRRRFLDHFSPHVLAQLQSEVPKEGSLLWLGRLVRKPRGIQAPVRHLLLMQFLGITAKQFFSLVPNEKKPDFGAGPFPCVNPLCPCFRQADIGAHIFRLPAFFIDASHFPVRIISSGLRPDSQPLTRILAKSLGQMPNGA